VLQTWRGCINQVFLVQGGATLSLVLIDNFLFLLCCASYADKIDTHVCTEILYHHEIKKLFMMAAPYIMHNLLSFLSVGKDFRFSNDLKENSMTHWLVNNLR